MILLATDSIETRHGIFSEHLFYNGLSQSIALTVGEVRGAKRLLCRIHSSCLSAHAFGSISCDCSRQMDFAQRKILEVGQGIIIWLEQEGRGNGHLAKMLAESHKRRGLSQGVAYEAVGFRADARDYVAAAEILMYFQVASVALLTNNLSKRSSLEASGLIVSEVLRIPNNAELGGMHA